MRRCIRRTHFILVVVHVRSVTVVTNSMHNCSGHRSSAAPSNRQRTVTPQRPVAVESRTWPDAMPMCVCCHHFRLLIRPLDRLDRAQMMAQQSEPLSNGFRFVFVAVAAFAHYSQFY